MAPAHPDHLMPSAKQLAAVGARRVGGSGRAIATHLALLGAFAAMQAVSCRTDPARSEASTLVRLVTEVREAPNPAKRGPLDRLRSMACSFPDICAAQAACVDAFEHHVRGVELGAGLHAALDASAPEPAGSAELAMRLLEMNLEVEEGNARMPLCEEKLTAVRIGHKM